MTSLSTTLPLNQFSPSSSPSNQNPNSLLNLPSYYRALGRNEMISFSIELNRIYIDFFTKLNSLLLWVDSYNLHRSLPYIGSHFSFPNSPSHPHQQPKNLTLVSWYPLSLSQTQLWWLHHCSSIVAGVIIWYHYDTCLQAYGYKLRSITQVYIAEATTLQLQGILLAIRQGISSSTNRRRQPSLYQYSKRRLGPSFATCIYH